MKNLIADAHSDIFTFYSSCESIVEYLKKLSQNNVRILFGAVWTTEMTKYSFDMAKEVLDALKRLKIDINVEITLEDLTFLEKSSIKSILNLKPFSAGLTWNYDNAFCGGAYENGELTLKGKHLIRKLEEAGIVIDLAHQNRKSFNSSLAVLNKRPLVSHACLDRFCENKRNLTDEQVKAIVELDGFFGICFVPKFLSKNRATSVDVVNNIDYFVQKFGCNNIGFGTDFLGSDELPEDLNNYNSMINIVEKLEKIGYNNQEIDKIFFKNLKDFIDKEKAL